MTGRGPVIDTGSKTNWSREGVFIRASGLTFDLSGPRRLAKPAGTGPLEGRVRPQLICLGIGDVTTHASVNQIAIL